MITVYLECQILAILTQKFIHVWQWQPPNQILQCWRKKCWHLFKRWRNLWSQCWIFLPALPTGLEPSYTNSSQWQNLSVQDWSGWSYPVTNQAGDFKYCCNCSGLVWQEQAEVQGREWVSLSSWVTGLIFFLSLSLFSFFFPFVILMLCLCLHE